jgi:hypothetical protein
MSSIRRDVVLTTGLSFGLSFVLTGAVWGDHSACAEIKAACRKAGFAIGRAKGDRLLLDCFKPIIQGTQRPSVSGRQLPNTPQQLVDECQASLAGTEASLDTNSASSLARTTGVQSSHTASGQGAQMPPVADVQLVHDSRLSVSWLADGNLAAKQTFGVSGINSNGSMDYATAVRWVSAMNAFNRGAGYLGHNSWQLPTTPEKDSGCERIGRNGESFGFHCSGSALGSLYYNTLGLREPNTAVSIPSSTSGPFSNFQPYLYWSKSPAADPRQGFVSFSFNTGFQGANVWRNHLYVLPIIKGKLPGMPPTNGAGLQVNPGGQTVYDPVSEVTWLANANLAAKQTFGVADINSDGSMDHNTAVRWVDSMNRADHGRGYLGQAHWELPETGASDPACSMKGTTGFECTASSMGGLFYKQLGFHRGESVVSTPDVKVGPFHNIQPYLYWACAAQAVQSACQTQGPAEGFEWNFSFGDGFQGTNLVRNYLYVIVYYADSATKTP